MTKTDDEAKDAAQAALEHRLVPEVDSVWKHYKGGFYVVVAVSLKEDTLEPLVTYRSNKKGTYWTRTLEDFLAMWTDRPPMSMPVHVERFAPIPD